MRSKLSLTNPPFEVPLECGVTRTETTKRYVKNGKIYTMTLRDKIAVEDPYLVMVRASAYAIRTGEPYGARTPRRDYRDVLVRSNLVI